MVILVNHIVLSSALIHHSSVGPFLCQNQFGGCIAC